MKLKKFDFIFEKSVIIRKQWLICSLENNIPVSVFIDEEGVEDIICAYYNEMYLP